MKQEQAEKKRFFQEHIKRSSQLVEAAMRADLAEVLTSCDPLLKEILEYSVFSGGKRVRPLLTILSSRICGRDDENLYGLAAAFEYLHIASLAHDDIIDNAKKRRGKASLVAKFGFAKAILAGDWLLSRSMRLIGELTGNQGLPLFCQSTEGMVDGEFLQLRCMEKPETSQDEYFKVIRCKTGNLISSTCEIGAVYAGANSAECSALRTYGDKIGAAFQIIDDILDYQGDAATTGKAVGNDFVEGKITLPLILTLELASARDAATLTNLLKGDRSHKESYDQTHELIQKYDGFQKAFTIAGELISQATAGLDLFADKKDRESLSMLHALAEYILKRKK